jgi:small subunit ribosomal protein S20
MANIKSAKKRAKQSEKRRMINLARRSSIKTAVKKVLTALEKGDSKEKTEAFLRSAESQLARAKGKGVIHYNTARRKISRLAKKVSAAFRG